MQKSYFKYTGDNLDVAILFLKNFLLTIFTLGIYRAWARTNLRRYVWSHVHFLDDKGTYTGHGKELFKGWTLLILIFLFGTIGFSIAFSILGSFLPSLVKGIIENLASLFAYFYIFSVASYSGYRYRLSRTKWRQINFAVDRTKDNTRQYSYEYIKKSFFTALTLGIYYPVFRNDTHKYLVNKSRIGSKPFRFEGEGREYFKIFWRNFLLCIVTLGIYTPWFVRNTLKYSLSKTKIEDATFGIDLQGKDLLVYGVTSWILLILTFGLATPWMYNWGLHLFINKIFLEGNVDIPSIQQTTSDGSTLADEVIQDYSLDFGF